MWFVDTLYYICIGYFLLMGYEVLVEHLMGTIDV